MLLRRATAIVTALGVLNLALAGSGLPCAGPPAARHAAHATDASDCAGEHGGAPRQQAPAHQHAPSSECCPAVHACSFAFADAPDASVLAVLPKAGALPPAGAIAASAPSIPPDPPPPRA